VLVLGVCFGYMAARTTPAVALVASRLIRAAARETRRKVSDCHLPLRKLAPPTFTSQRHRRHTKVFATSAALPENSHLKAHPLFQLKTGAFSIHDFELVVDTIDLQNGVAPVKIVRPKSEDAVLDMYVELGRLDHDPYWAALWPSSIALAREVASASKQDVVKNKHVCDLGAGLGLAGMAAAMAGAQSVTFYDREPLALQCCLLSAEANGLNVLRVDGDTEKPGFVVTRGKTDTEGAGSIPEGGEDDDGAKEKDEEDDAKDDVAKQSKRTDVSALVFDWNAVPVGQPKFDLVLACDVLYEKHAVLPVALLVPQLTTEKKGTWLLADPPNRAPKNREEFIALVTRNDDRKMKLVNEPKPVVITHRGSTDTVLLLEFQTEDDRYLYECS